MRESYCVHLRNNQKMERLKLNFCSYSSRPGYNEVIHKASYYVDWSWNQWEVGIPIEINQIYDIVDTTTSSLGSSRGSSSVEEVQQTHQQLKSWHNRTGKD